MTYRLTRSAEAQIADVLADSERDFGIAAAERYRLLVFEALKAIGEHPNRAGSQPVARLSSGVRLYPLRLSRTRVAPAARVGTPRHALVYRVVPEGEAVVFGLVHESMSLVRAIRRLTRQSD